MALSDRLASPPPLTHPLRCGIGQLLAEASDADAAALRELIDRPDWTATAIRIALLAEGFSSPSGQSIRRHRNGECSCEVRGVR